MTQPDVAPDLPRRDQEPRGRWENRCDYITSLSIVGAPWLVCDRPDGHGGMHSGRLLNSDYKVMGYGRKR